MQLKDKLIVVTGAGSGIGRSLAKKFIAAGARTVIASDINADAARQTAEELGCVPMTADVAREEDVLRLIDDTERKFGPIDLYCNNAGVAMGASPRASLAWMKTARALALFDGLDFVTPDHVQELATAVLAHLHQRAECFLICPSTAPTATCTRSRSSGVLASQYRSGTSGARGLNPPSA